MRVDECKEEEDKHVFAVAGEAQGGKLMVNMRGIPVEMIIDSGGSANVIIQALWEQLKKQHIKCVSRRSTKKLYAYGAVNPCLLYTSPSPRDLSTSRMPSSA